MPEPAGPLSGVVVVDFTEYVAGPYSTMMLADMGADVIKVEPYEGDHWRRQQPVAPYETRYFMGLNRAKRSIALRGQTPEGRAVVEDLVRRADVVMVNYRPGVAAQLGLDYDTLVKLKPDLIYCAITAFGDRGPYADRPGFDILLQAMTGIIDFERKIDRGVPLGISSFAPADLSTAMFTAYAIVTALFHRERTGEGQRIDTSLLACALAIQYRPLFQVESLDAERRALMLESIAAARENGQSYQDMLKFRSALGLQRVMALYYRVYQTKDSLMAVACLNNRQRRGLRDAVGIDDPAVDGDVYHLQPDMTDEMLERKIAEFEEGMRQRTTAEWLEVLPGRDVPCVPVLLNEEVFDHPQVAESGVMLRLEHPVAGPLRQAGSPLRMSKTKAGVAKPSPALSADARDVLAWLGYSPERITQLEAAEVVRRPQA